MKSPKKLNLRAALSEWWMTGNTEFAYEQCVQDGQVRRSITNHVINNADELERTMLSRYPTRETEFSDVNWESVWDKLTKGMQ